MAAVVRAGQALVGFWLLSCTFVFHPMVRVGSGSGLDVFQIPQHRKALFVGGKLTAEPDKLEV